MGDGNFDLGRVFGQTLGVTARHFLPLFLLAMFFYGIPYALILALPSAVYGGLIAIPPEYRVWLPLAGGFVVYLSALVLQGALTRAAVDALSGKGVNLGAALGAGFRFMFPLLGLGLLMGIAIGLGLLLLIIPGLYLMVRYSVSSPALIMEDLGITGAMERSRDLTAGHRWPIFGLLLVYGALTYGLGIALARFGGTLDHIANGVAIFAGIPVVTIIVTSAIEVALRIIGTIGTASIYFELRRADEGVDVSQLASVFE